MSSGRRLLTYLLSSPHFLYIDLDTYRSNVELNSTVLSAVHVLMSSFNRRVILHCFMLVFPKLLLACGLFWISNIRDILKKNNLDKSVGTHKHNLVHYRLKFHLPPAGHLVSPAFGYLWSIALVHAFFWVIPRRLEFICRLFGGLCLFHLHRRVDVSRMNSFLVHSTHIYLPMKMEQTECSETSAYKLQAPENYPKKVYNI
jgi:hypothetical protein